MENQMRCPYCGQEMRDGAIPIGRDYIQWCPRNENGRIGGENGAAVLLGKPALFAVAYTPARYCESCRTVIVPVPEIDTLADKLDRKLDALRERRAAQREEREQHREEGKREKRREKRRKSDPWEE